MKRFSTFVVAVCLCGNAVASDADFERVADRFVSDLPAFSPIAATRIGDHSVDSELDQVDAAARAGLIGAYEDYRDSLAKIDRDSLSRANQVDYELLSAEIESRLWSLETLQEWAWNPLYYVNGAGSAIYDLVARDFAPVEQRLANVASRLEQFPRYFDQARTSLQLERIASGRSEMPGRDIGPQRRRCAALRAGRP